MKKTIYTISLILISVITAISQDITFTESMDKAFERAKKENKIIFVDAYATWCGPCKYMAKNVFTVDSVAKFYNTNFVCLKIDVDIEEGTKFMKNYPVAAMPTFFFIKPTGEVVKKVMGGMEADKFYNLGKDVIYPEQAMVYIMGQKYKSGNRDKSFLAEYALELPEEDSLLKIVISEYFKDQPVSCIDSIDGFAVFSLWTVGIESEFAKYFAGKYDDFLLSYGKYAQNKLNSIIMAEIESATALKNKSRLENLYNYLQPVYRDDEAGFADIKRLIEQAYEQAVNKEM
ncbi:MAG: hypothetical protein A2W91_04220 [Bacteroidetes bacterium GWF2_38_335]|nr:MAG: hypothetical protein A2W91_04220 [Bacteroidetes bacterium GWF2_38_335]OFY79155.1 MAG: hypothetical protein A2281_03555 [Bacteroidetes bacterium RIFOXYA12_FULL_38_20]HBS88757.1 hypothetical protein [Bacteroidales bacterium]